RIEGWTAIMADRRGSRGETPLDDLGRWPSQPSDEGGTRSPPPTSIVSVAHVPRPASAIPNLPVSIKGTTRLAAWRARSPCALPNNWAQLSSTAAAEWSTRDLDGVKHLISTIYSCYTYRYRYFYERMTDARACLLCHVCRAAQ